MPRRQNSLPHAEKPSNCRAVYTQSGFFKELEDARQKPKNHAWGWRERRLGVSWAVQPSTDIPRLRILT